MGNGDLPRMDTEKNGHTNYYLSSVSAEPYISARWDFTRRHWLRGSFAVWGGKWDYTDIGRYSRT